MNSSSDQNLVFGLLAFQSGFISRDQLLDSLLVWSQKKDKDVGQILLEQESFDQQTYELLAALVAKHFEVNENQSGDGPRNFSSVDDELTNSLQQIGDSDLSESLRLVGRSDPVTIRRTAAGRLGGQTGKSPSESRFSVIRPHAKGGLGEVFVAFDRELNRQVALKEIQGQYAFDESSRQRFMLEAEITGGLEHPGIVPVYGLGTYDDGRPFYAMRFIKGDSLSKAGRWFHENHNHPTSEDYQGSEFRKLLGRLVDVCFSIEYAHSRGVLHRDLKPGNIMLGKYGETLVVDWGLAKAKVNRSDSHDVRDEETLRPSSGSDSLQTQLGQAVGTPAYMSPEAAAGRLDQLGPKSDIYCLGATLYYLLCGQAPHDRKNPSFPESVKKGEFKNPRQVKPSVPKPLEAICLRAMQFDPKLRYESAKALAEDVERWLADEPISVYADPIAARLGRLVRRNKGAVTSAAAFLVAAIVGLGVFAVVLGGKNRQLTSAYQTANQSWVESEKQRTLAEENETTARKIATSIAEIAEQRLSQTTGQEGFREEIMDRSYQLLSRAYIESPDDATLAWDLAKIGHLTGNLKVKRAKPDEAKRMLAQSIELQNQLGRIDDASQGYLASTYRDQGSLGKTIGDLTMASESFRKAGEILEELLARSKDDDNLKRTAASLELERAGMYEGLVEDQAALESADRSAKLFLEVVDGASVGDLDYALALMAISRHGQALARLGQHAQARAVYEEGIRLGSQWEEEHGSHRDFRYAFGRMHLYFSEDLRLQTPVPDDGLELVEKAVQAFQILADSSTSASYRYYLGCAHRTKAAHQTAQGMFDLADAEFDRSIELLGQVVSEFAKPHYHSALAKSHALKSELRDRNGDEASAAELIQKAIEHQRKSVELGPSSLFERQVLVDYEARAEAIERGGSSPNGNK